MNVVVVINIVVIVVEGKERDIKRVV